MIKIIKGSSEQVFKRVSEKVDVANIVSDIISSVREKGDKALFEYCYKFDKANLTDLRVSEKEIEDAVNSVDQKYLEILKN